MSSGLFRREGKSHPHAAVEEEKAQEVVRVLDAA